MKITFYGVRGSIAAPGPDTAKVGGNTSCVLVELEGGERIVLDAGTGLRSLGNRLMASREPCDLSILLSHYHWDHIQGLPFFVPMYVPGSRIEVVGGVTGATTVRDTLLHQMSAPVFPVALDEVGATLTTREVRPGSSFDLRGARVRVAKLNHPGGVFAYRVEHGGRSVVYATDTEHYSCVAPALVALARGADVLVYDAQYLPSEYGAKVGWGHSTYAAGAEVARAAGVGSLVLFHHDPTRDDAGVAAIEAAARELFPRTIAARESMVVEVGEPKVLAA
jgi:phosphoribosyl 1,2-cyclic phosphodiesterase